MVGGDASVKAGDRVVLNPTVDLTDGRRVKTRAPATQSVS
jgi:hypothetical protein